MTTKELQDRIAQSFEIFGDTPFDERMDDIQKEYFHFIRYRDPKNLKEEVGDLVSSLIQLCNEKGWELDDVIGNTLNKIDRRKDQYGSLGRRVQVAILGGAFDPIHNGHIQLAQHVLNLSGVIDEVWLMPPASHMYGKKMESAQDRLNMCRLAAERDRRIRVFNYEVEHKLAGETYFFFKKLLGEKELNEKYEFSMIIGLDNANFFDKWVNYKYLERMVRFIVVPRKGVTRDPKVDWYLRPPHVFMNEETEIMEISSTQVRKMLQENDPNITKYLDPKVVDYIKENHLYGVGGVVEKYNNFVKKLK
jgi:nicotinate-nucleotide adenylyltransferase